MAGRQLLGPALLTVPLLAACGMGAGAPSGEGRLSPQDPAWITPETSGPTSRCERRVHTPAPTRSVLEQPCGTVVAILTDGARTARLVRTPRTFTEPTAAAPIQSRDWVR